MSIVSTKLIDYFDDLDKFSDEKERKKILKAYNEWVIYQPSIIDGDDDIARPHHVLTGNNHGMSLKPHDLWQVPMTYKQHIKIHSSNGFREMQDIVLEKLPEFHEKFLLEMGWYDILDGE